MAAKRFLFIGIVVLFVAAAPAGCGRHDDRTQRKIDGLLATINDRPTNGAMLHTEYTPSVRALIAMGKDALPSTLELMSCPDELTRLRALTVLCEITARMHGFGERGWPDGMEDAYRRFLSRLGNLDWQGGLEKEQQRKTAIQMWRQWLVDGCPIDSDRSGPATPEERKSG
jgi:hypothetical protein